MPDKYVDPFPGLMEAANPFIDGRLAELRVQVLGREVSVGES